MCIYGVHMITAVMAVWLRAGVRRALGWSAAHPRAHVWSAQTGRPPAYLWFWWLLAVAGDVFQDRVTGFLGQEGSGSQAG